MSSAIANLREQHAARFRTEGTPARKIGIELEFPLVRSDAERFGEAISADQMKRILRDISDNTGWEATDEGFALKPMRKGDPAHISAEAGICTVEVGLPPANSLGIANHLIAELTRPMIDSAKENRAFALGYGVQPLTPPSIVLISPLNRYQMMLKTRGRFYSVVQDDSDIAYAINAAVHFHVSAKDQEDAVRVANILNGFSPEFLLLSANSRVTRGIDSGRADTRAMFYEDYLRERYGRGVPDRFSGFGDYFDRLCSLPVELLRRNGYYVTTIDRMTLGQFLSTGSAHATMVGEGGSVALIHPIEEDVITVEGTVRWEARPKGGTGSVELRTCSMQRSRSDIMALAAIVKGLASNIDKAEMTVLGRDIDRTRLAKRQIANEGFGIDGARIRPVGEMLDIAREGLVSIHEEVSFLKPAYERLYSSATPSEESLQVLNDRGMRAFIESLRFEI
ncbi:MAG: hypothetical protein KGH72_00810 [Candidatus Micrarchaeota archaeon]|nr:hypothetical protein [Candidatus Micrarchaeota archaeon]